jgi:hypothetical protein
MDLGLDLAVRLFQKLFVQAVRRRQPEELEVVLHRAAAPLH